MRRFLLVAISAFGILMLSSALVIGATVAYSGLITVRVNERESGMRFYIPVPAALVELGSVIVPLVVPADEMEQFQRDLDEWSPLIRAVLLSLEDVSNATLVEVHDGDTFVRVVKRGRSLKVHVDSPDALVDVSIPTPAVRRSVARIIG